MSAPLPACLPCADTRSKDWRAWNSLHPPQPNTFQIFGDVLVPNPGVDVLLVQTEPQGFNPEVLLLDIYLVQQPGDWPATAVWKPATYRRPIGATGYTHAEVLCAGTPIASVEVQNVH